MDDEKSSSNDTKRVQYTTKLTSAHFELLERCRITFGTTRTFFPFRCILEHCVRMEIDVPGLTPKDFRTPRITSTKTTTRAVSDLNSYASWLNEHVRQVATAKRGLRLNHATRLRIITRLARWPARENTPWLTAPVTIDASTFRRSSPQAIHVPLIYDEAVKKAAAELGSFSELARVAIDAFAAEHEFAQPGVLTPTFQRYPLPPLVTMQRSIEEPALAILYAMHVIDKRPADDETPVSLELEALLDTLVRMPPTDGQQDE